MTTEPIRDKKQLHQLAGYWLKRGQFGYHAWINGTSPVVLMDIYNYSSYEITCRYLGVSQDDRDKVYLAMALF